MDLGRFKKKKNDKAWLDWLSDDAPSEISSPDDSFPVDPGSSARQPLLDESPEFEPKPKRPEVLRPIPVVKEAPPERRPIFGAGSEVPKFARRPTPAEPEPTPRRQVVAQPTPVVQSVAPTRPQSVRRVSAPPVKSEASATPVPAGVSIQINMPAFHKPQFKRSKAAWAAAKPHITRARILRASIPLIVIALLWGGLMLNKQRLDHKHAAAVAAEASSAPLVAASTKPTFTPVVPAANAKLGTPDNTHSRYDATKKSYSFLDTLDGKQITVSQQQLPANGTTASDTVAKAAKSLNATSQFKTGYGTVYVFNSQKYGYQSLVFSVRDLLVFANSPSVIANDKWTDYINALN